MKVARLLLAQIRDVRTLFPHYGSEKMKMTSSSRHTAETDGKRMRM
jgi:hypothetical protein